MDDIDNTRRENNNTKDLIYSDIGVEDSFIKILQLKNHLIKALIEHVIWQLKKQNLNIVG